jgi:AcrR family transcriptional regulator
MSRAHRHPRSTTRPRARRGEGERLREEILEAAERLLIETGNEDAVSIRGIAEAVGVSPPAIYLHFPDKETLVFAVCERQFEWFDLYMEDAARDIDDPIEELRARGRAYVRFGLEHPESYRIMFMGRSTMDPQRRDIVAKAGVDAFGHLVEAVERARAAGRLRDDGSSVDAALWIWTGVHGLTSLLISTAAFPLPDRDELVRRNCALLLRALEQR